MDSISNALHRRVSLYHKGIADGILQPDCSYRYMLAADVYDELLPIFGAAMVRCPTPSQASLMTAGSLYCEIYTGLTGRSAKLRDRANLDKLECELMNPEQTPQQ